MAGERYAFGALEVAEDLSTWDPVNLPDFKPADAQPLVRQYLLFHTKWDPSLEPCYLLRMTGGWRPNMLQHWRDAGGGMPGGAGDP